MPTAPRPPAAAGGVLIAGGPIVGAVVGALFGEATPGALIGLALGVGAALAIWWRDR